MTADQVVNASAAAALANAQPGQAIKLAPAPTPARSVTTKAGTASAPITLTGGKDSVITGVASNAPDGWCPNPQDGYHTGYGPWLSGVCRCCRRSGPSVPSFTSMCSAAMFGPNLLSSTWIRSLRSIPFDGYGCGNVFQNNSSDLGGVGQWAFNVTPRGRSAAT